LVQAVRGWFAKDVAVVPEEAIYPPDQTQQQIQRANRQEFLTSEQAAESAALGHLGYPEKVVVQDFSPGSPSKGALEEGDAIESVNGTATPDPDVLNKVLTAISGG